jgi:NAD(P)H-hydrate epimerase
MQTSVINSPQLWKTALPQIDVEDNKYSRGHAVIFGGYPLTGAARMAARAAARMGAGLTTIAVSDEALPIYSAALESVMVKSISATHDREQLISDDRVTAYLIGPGAGVTAETRTLVLKLLATRKPLVIDADAISVFQHDPKTLFDAIHGPCVLTPHEGEFARIFAMSESREQRAVSAAEMAHATVVLKGAKTLIATPNNPLIINESAPANLATAGTGDVLAGMILGLLAQKMNANLASAAAVWMHGEAAKKFGKGLIAEDLPDLLPSVWKEIAEV